MKKILTGIAFLILVSGCAAVATKAVPQYRVAGIIDGVEVRVYKTRRDFLGGIPALVAAFSDSIEKVAPGTGVGGYYDRAAKIIHLAGENAVNLVHEFKHHLEPEWVHGFTPTLHDQGWRQVGLDKIFALRGREFSVRDGETVDSAMARLRKFLK